MDMVRAVANRERSSSMAETAFGAHTYTGTNYATESNTHMLSPGQ